MSTLFEWLSRFTGLIRGNRTSRLAEELNSHIELLTDDYVRRGMTESEARSAALREVGNFTHIEQEYREQNSLPVLENLWRDLVFALRMLRRAPAYTLSCTATMAVGLGSMITVLCVVSAILWKPLPYPEAKRLVVIKEVDPRNGTWPFTEPDLVDLSERTKSLAAVAAFRSGVSALTGAGDPETVPSAAVTASSFALFGIRPIVGHVFQDSQKEVVIGRGLWKRKWQMSTAAIGKAIVVDGETYTITGVADLPADLLPGAELLLPLLPKATESRTAHEIEAVGLIRTGVEIGQAQAELSAIAESIARENPRSNAGWNMRLVRLSDYVIGPDTRRMVWMILAAVALLWVLACANVAGLQVARSIARRHEMGTRMALGASSLRLFGQTLTESLVLAVFGSFVGLVGAQYATNLIRDLGARSLPRLAGLNLDFRTIGTALGCLLVSTLLCAVFAARTPAFQGGRKISRRERGRDGLIVAQVALASVLLLGAGLLLESFLRLRAVNPGFDPQRILAVSVRPSAPADDSPRRVAFFQDATERLARLPETDSVGATNVSPFTGEGTANRFRLEGEFFSAEYRSAAWRAVTPGFFATLGVPLKRGRLFTDRDAAGSLEVVILSESMARKFWPNQDPIGKRLLWGRSGNPKTIVGIVGDLRDLAVDTPPAPTMFRPYAQLSDAPMTLVIRTKSNTPVSAIADIRREIWAVDREATLEFHPVLEAMADSILRPRVSLAAFAGFATIAIIIAGFGLFGLISYRVNQRQQEIGVRLALGCPASAVRWSVQKRCLLLVCSGLAIGLPTAYALSMLMASLLYETKPTQTSAYAMVLVVFVGIALSASYGPAKRASRMDPSAAIRHE
jgi:putative ABC transport system permease protein